MNLRISLFTFSRSQGGEDDDEREELEVLPTDNLIVVAKTQDEISQIEVYVYDESQENLYAHHDLMLPNFPLCLEWLDFPPAGSPSTSQKKEFGNYIAVGTMDPEIEVWSLDMLEGMYPDTVLGRPDKTTAHVPVPLGTGKKKKKKSTRLRPRGGEVSGHGLEKGVVDSDVVVTRERDREPRQKEKRW